MPRAKPDQVIIHRLELQESERRMLETAVTAYSIRNVSRGVFNLTSDVTTVVILLVLYEMITSKTVIDDALIAALSGAGGLAEWMVGSWYDYRQTDAYRQEYNERATSVTGGLHNIWDQIWGALMGESVQRYQEEQENN